MQLSVTIVNFRSAKLIAACIESAFQFPSAQNFEWIIVDNCSNDNSKNFITHKFPFVKWIDMNFNSGFARANNEGIRQSKNDVFLLLNPDVIILNDAVEKCYQKFIHSSAIACSVQLLNADHSPQITGSFFMKGGLNHLLPLPYLGALFRKIAFAFKVKKTNVPQASAEEKVDWLNGAFMMIKKSAIEKAGMFDEDFFLYAEEIEWCSRLKKAGELVVYGDLNCIHLQGETINEETNSTGKGYFNLYDKKGLQLMVSQMVRIRKQFGVFWFLFHLMIFTIEIPVFGFCNLFDSLFHKKNPLRNNYLIEGFTNNVLKVWKMMPTIIRNKPHFYKMF